MVFVAGIDSLEKIEFCQKAKALYGIQSFNFDYQAGGLCHTSEFYRNMVGGYPFFLKGNFCYLGQNQEIISVDGPLIVGLKPERIIIIKDASDNNIMKQKLWKNIQDQEVNYGKMVGKALDIEVHIVKGSWIYSNDARNLFTPKSLLLPIHSVYADKIFAGSKKYEYRKRLCKGFIKKIYIYETVPVKKITGEVDVIRKLRDKKESLWELTHHAGGIGLEAYNQYFNRGIHACAYELGNARKYRQPRRLEEFGITYPPQGAVYVNQEF